MTFDELVESYTESIRSAWSSAASTFSCPRRAFDTLNMKACLFAISKLFEDRDINLPVMVSGTIIDKAGRTLSGQTIEAFWHSVSHFDLLSVGINCALGADLMRPHVERLSEVASCFISCYPNAGMPDGFGGFDDSPEHMAEVIGEFAANGWLNIVGGCCGTTPTYIKQIADAVAGRSRPAAPRPQPHLTQPQRPGTADDPPRDQLHHGRRAHQHHRLEEVRPPDQGRAITKTPWPSPSTRLKAGRTSSTSTWTRG